MLATPHSSLVTVLSELKPGMKLGKVMSRKIKISDGAARNRARGAVGRGGEGGTFSMSLISHHRTSLVNRRDITKVAKHSLSLL